MKKYIELVESNKKALIFLAKFVTLYFVCNSLYGLYVSLYSGADPFTIAVSRNVEIILSWFYRGVHIEVLKNSVSVPFFFHGEPVISVFEGCNGINVWIVFIVFIISFSRHWYHSIWFILVASLGIYLLNILRIIGLFWVARQFPESLYFIHKFIFTGVIYLGVFLLWITWVKFFRHEQS